MSGWQLRGTKAQLQRNDLDLSFDWQQPALGMRLGHPSIRTTTESQLFGLELPFPKTSCAPLGSPAVTCGSSLRVNYAATDAFPVRAEVSLTAPSKEGLPALAVLDLVLSVCTDNLEARPQVRVCSKIPASEVLTGDCLLRERATRWSTDALQFGGTVEGQDEDNGCVIFRLNGDDLSYLEIVYPGPHQRSRILPADGARMIAEHTLFAATLEKGVILRARVRGAILQRQHDTDSAADVIADFLSAAPPLGP